MTRIGSGKLAAAGIALALCLPYPAGAQGGFNGPGRYEITNLKSGKVLDLDRNDQTSVIQFSSRGTDNQMWDIRAAGSGFYSLQSVMNGNALETTGNRNSTPVRATRFNGGSSQQWRFVTGKDGNALIVSRLGKTLDIPDGTNSDGARVQIYDSNGDSNQQFTFRQVSGNQGYGNTGNTYSSNTIVCSSNNGRRTHCDADTQGGVRLIRQIGGSSCQEGSTWGSDSSGVWVDRGCQAEFEVSNKGSAVYQAQYRGLDQNNDGVVTRNEWRGNDQSFRQQDRNGDGILSGNELQTNDRRRGRGRR
jgi:hypothetical protein